MCSQVVGLCANAIIGLVQRRIPGEVVESMMRDILNILSKLSAFLPGGVFLFIYYCKCFYLFYFSV